MEEEKAGEFLQAYLRGHGLVGIESKDNHYHSCHLDEQGSTLYVTSQWAEAENRYQSDAFGNLLD